MPKAPTPIDDPRSAQQSPRLLPVAGYSSGRPPVTATVAPET